MNKTLLIIDLQKGFGATEDLVEQINQLAASYETVLATKFVNGNTLFQNVLEYPELSEQEMELEKLPEDTKVFQKTGYGLPDELLSFLQKNNVSELDVCGLETDACVLAAMYSLWDAGIAASTACGMLASNQISCGNCQKLLKKKCNKQLVPFQTETSEQSEGV